MNYYTQGVNTEALPCSEKQCKELANLCLPREAETGIRVVYIKEKKGAMICGDEFFVPENLPQNALEMIAKLLKRAKMTHLMFRIAYTADGIVINGYGGSFCIIDTRGAVGYENTDRIYSCTDQFGEESILRADPG